MVKAQKAEIERLRAALEQIIELTTADWYGDASMWGHHPIRPTSPWKHSDAKRSAQVQTMKTVAYD